MNSNYQSRNFLIELCRLKPEALYALLWARGLTAVFGAVSVFAWTGYVALSYYRAGFSELFFQRVSAAFVVYMSFLLILTSYIFIKSSHLFFIVNSLSFSKPIIIWSNIMYEYGNVQLKDKLCGKTFKINGHRITEFRSSPEMYPYFFYKQDENTYIMPISEFVKRISLDKNIKAVCGAQIGKLKSHTGEHHLLPFDAYSGRYKSIQISARELN